MAIGTKCKNCGLVHPLGQCTGGAQPARSTHEIAVVVRKRLDLPKPEPAPAAQRTRRKGKSGKGSRTKVKKPLPVAADKPWTKTYYAPPGDCGYCDARRTYSAEAMRKSRASPK